MPGKQNKVLHRHSIRLLGYDYSDEGGYFITLVTHKRECLFGEILDCKMKLNGFGNIAREEWFRTRTLRSNIELLEDEFVVMPNHIHGILWLTENVGTSPGKGTARRALTSDAFGKPVCGSLATVVGAYKSAVTKRINLVRETPGAPVWLRNYYEHIICTEKEYKNITNYIDQNLVCWETNDEYKDNS